MRETSKPAGKCTPYRRSMWPPELGGALSAALVGRAEDLPGTNRSKIASSLSSPGFRDAQIRAKTSVDTVMVRIVAPSYLSIVLYISKLVGRKMKLRGAKRGEADLSSRLSRSDHSYWMELDGQLGARWSGGGAIRADLA